MHANTEHAAKLTREWAKVLGSRTEETNGPESGNGGKDGLVVFEVGSSLLEIRA